MGDNQNDLLDVMNQIFIEGSILDSQKHDIIVCLPKTHKPALPEEYRPLTWMNADYKLLSRIVTYRLRQHCGVRDNNILEALTAIGETIAKAELNNAPAFLLSLDFKGALDSIAHSNLFVTL